MVARSSTLYGEVEFTIRNQVNDIVLISSICHISKGEKDGKFSAMILPKRSACVKVKASLSSAGCIECCLVYELIDQKNESEPVMEDYQVFIAVRVFGRPLVNKYRASAVMFMARKGQFTGKEGDIKQLHEDILRKHLVNNTYSFECAIKALMLSLEATFYSGRQAIIEVILKETTGHTDKRPVLFK
jgi:hypothetical protein